MPSELLNLAAQIGQFTEYWGFKSIHGKIWVLLYLSKKPLSSIELSKILRVSKTLLSFSIAELLRYEVIEKAGTGPKRTVYFRANPDITSVILNVLNMREREMIKGIESAFEQFKKSEKKGPVDPTIEPSQLSALGTMIQSAKQALDAFSGEHPSQVSLVDQLNLMTILLSEKKSI